MSPKLRLLLAFALAAPIGALAAPAAKTYQVTGPIVALTPSAITVRKDDGNWEIARDANPKTEPAMKVGDRVTVYYRMHATKIEVKTSSGDGAKKPEKAGGPGRRKKSG